MNRIIDYIIEQRKGHYCHALELANVYELQSTIDAIYDEFIEHYYVEEIIDFFHTISLYYIINDDDIQTFLNDEAGTGFSYNEAVDYLANDEDKQQEEKELYNFDIEEYINNL